MDAQEFRQVFDQYRMRVFFFCKKFFDNKQEAEDATSATFINLWHNREAVDVDKAQAFLMISAKNKCMDYIKHTKLHNAHAKKYAEIVDYTNMDVTYEVLATINAIIEALPEKQKRIFKLKYFEENKPLQISKLLNVSPQTVKNMLHTSMTTIRKELKNRGIEDHGLAAI